MKIRILVAGKPALPFAKLACDDYLKRIRRLAACEFIMVKAGDPASVSERLLHASESCHRIALDERGEALTTRGLESKIATLELDGSVKTLAFLIGAADGHTEALRKHCDLTLALSSLTLQHELALVVLLEQIYRVESIRAGMPYHRD